MLTAKDVQTLLQVDRSTVYRMAEDGRLPAVKVGKQWRFFEEQIDQWLGEQTGKGTGTAVAPPPSLKTLNTPSETENLAHLLPLECVQLIQESYAELLGVMIVITDMEGIPITRISNPCGLFSLISEVPDAIQKCMQSWQTIGATINLEPHFYPTHLRLLCTRGLIRVGKELQGMVVAGCVAPEKWPPTAAEVSDMAATFGVDPASMTECLDEVFTLNKTQQNTVLTTVQSIADIVSHIVHERQQLVQKLHVISQLAQL